MKRMQRFTGRVMESLFALAVIALIWEWPAPLRGVKKLIGLSPRA